MHERSKIVEFVIYKQKRIKEFGCPVDYINENDIEDILSWDEEECDLVWTIMLCTNIFSNTYPGLGYDQCPWCLLYDGECDLCNYGLKHGFCGIELCENDYNKIIEFFANHRTESSRTAFSNSWYRKIIKNINNKYDDDDNDNDKN